MKETNNYSDLLNLIKPEKRTPSLEPGSKFYIPVKGENVEFVVIGADVNPNPGEQKNHFVDVMTTSIFLKNIPWVQKTRDDNLDAVEFRNLHYTRSNVMKVLEDQKQYLPQEIQDSIIPRKAKFLTGVDFVSGDRKYDFVDIGSIWLPSMKEICGEVRFSDDCPNVQQYPYFEEDKHKQLGGYWWLRSAGAFYDWYACYVCPDGDWFCRCAGGSDMGVPLCFRLKVND